jgi:hypothetical protein
MKFLRRILGSETARARERVPEQVSSKQAPNAMPPAIVPHEDRRHAVGVGVSVLKLEPQVASGERVDGTEREVVERTLAEQLRREDRYCAMEDDSYVIVLAATGDEQGVAVAQRLASEVRLQVECVQGRNWRASVATYPRDPKTQIALVRLSQDPARRVGVR